MASLLHLHQLACFIVLLTDLLSHMGKTILLVHEKQKSLDRYICSGERTFISPNPTWKHILQEDTNS